MTSQTITINSDYFQVTPEGIVTCQALGVTGGKSFINLNDTFIVNSFGNVFILDNGRYDESIDANFTVRNANGTLTTSIYSGEIDIDNRNNKLRIHGVDYTYSTLDIANGIIGMWQNSDTEQDHAIIIKVDSGPTIHCGQTNTSTQIYESYMYCSDYRNLSSADLKKNIKLYDKKALPEILKTDIYSYNYNSDSKDSDKKIGVVIGNDYNCTDKIISDDNKSINLYSMISLSYKAIQELAKEVEELKNGKAN